jgi:hypothetical protein
VDSDKEEEEGLVSNNNMSKPSNKQEIHVLRETQVLCIAKWQEYVSNIQQDLLALEGQVFSLHTLKDEAQKEFEKVEGQVEYCFMFIASRETKLSQLQSKLNSHILNVYKFHFENSFAKAIVVAFVEQESMQRKFDLQLCFIKSFRYLSQIREDEHSRLQVQQVSNENTWHSTSMKFDTWKQHKVTLSV